MKAVKYNKTKITKIGSVENKEEWSTKLWKTLTFVIEEEEEELEKIGGDHGFFIIFKKNPKPKYNILFCSFPSRLLLWFYNVNQENQIFFMDTNFESI